MSTTLFFNGDNATDLLSQLGMASKISDQSQGCTPRRCRTRTPPSRMTDKADVAKAALKVLPSSAESDGRGAGGGRRRRQALQEQQDKDATLKAQLASLTDDDRADGGGLPRAGVEGAKRRRAKKGRRLRPRGRRGCAAQNGERRRRQVGTSGAGPRPRRRFHRQPTTVSGVNSVLGYMLRAPRRRRPRCRMLRADLRGALRTVATPGERRIRQLHLIDHGGGRRPAYGHIVDGGILVHAGQAVGSGQNIARVGTTGDSTGCHLHFEVHVNGGRDRPGPVHARRGISVGKRPITLTVTCSAPRLPKGPS